MRVASSAGGMSPSQRAQVIANRLNSAFASGASWQNVQVAQVGNQWAVTLNGRLIATADQVSARALGVSPPTLASNWARQTVVASGGQPQAIAMQLQPVPQRVAGSQQQLGQPSMWCNTLTKTVPFLSAASGSQLGEVTIGGSQNMLNMTNAVVGYQRMSGNAVVWAFVPITGSSTTGTLTRVNGVGLVSIPQSMMDVSKMQTGASVSSAVTQMGSQWNSMINSALSSQGLQFRGGATTKVVPLYSPDSGDVVGAVQVVGSPSAVSQTQSVAVAGQSGMWQFQPSSTAPGTSAANAQNNVLVSAIIMMRTPSTAPTTTEPGVTQPQTTQPGTTTTQPQTTQPSEPSSTGTGTTTTPETPSSTPPPAP